MKSVLIAIGNSLRCDDGVAHRVLDLLGPLPNVLTLDLFELTPEVAEEIATAETVIFLDADIHPGTPRLEQIGPECQAASSLGHALQPVEVAGLARILYGFSGTAWICHIPGKDFSEGNELSPVAEQNAQIAVNLLTQMGIFSDVER